MAQIGTRKLKIEIDATEHTASVSNARIVTGESDSDFISFADAAAGGAREYRLAFTAAQDAATGSLWSEVFDNAGDSVPVTLMPYGNAVASAEEPHFEMTAVITEPDGDFLGGEANSSASARFTFDCEWVLEAKPTRVTV